MFRSWPGVSSLGVAAETVAAIIESINTPNVSLQEHGTEPTKGYLVAVMLPNGGFRLFCYLLQLESNRPVIFVCDPDQVTVDQYPAMESVGITFLENMGFMLDNMNLRGRAVAEQQAILAHAPFLAPQLVRTRTKPLDDTAAHRAAAARYLASF
jgi:hypothetical protein